MSRRGKRPDPRLAIHEIGRLEDDLTQLVRAKASGELPAGSPVQVNVPPAMIPLPLASAIARTRQLRQDILAQSGVLCDLLSEAFTTGHRGQLAAAIEDEASQPRGEVAAELCQIVRDLELTLPQLEASLECLDRCSTLHRTMAAELDPRQRRAYKELAERIRDQTGE
jgi:hypothetical protein